MGEGGYNLSEVAYVWWGGGGEVYYNLPRVALPDAIGIFYSSFINFLLFNLKTIGVEF